MNNINHFFINRRINNEVKKYIKNKLLECRVIDNTLIIYTNDHLFKEIKIRIVDGKEDIIFINHNKINNKINNKIVRKSNFINIYNMFIKYVNNKLR